jgi:TIR domain
MGEATYPKPVNEVLTTLVEIFQHQNKSEIAELLRNAHAHYDQVDYDNWNGGTYTWALRLELPVSLFASIEPRIEAIKEEIGTKLRVFKDLYTNDFLNGVIISPVLPGMAAFGQRMTPSENEVQRLWAHKKFRLFLSHVSRHKVKVAMLKKQLSLRGIDAFVAHEDIEPSLEWQAEIELGLRSMHAMVALITPDFHDSLWTDQEVGWALGRGVLVLPVRLGADPYGFAGKVQAVAGNLDDPVALAESIVRCLLTNQLTHGEMRRALVASFSDSSSFEIAKVLQKHLVTVDDLSEDDKASLHTTCIENSQVRGAWGVVDAIHQKIGKPPKPKTAKVDDIPF